MTHRKMFEYRDGIPSMRDEAPREGDAEVVPAHDLVDVDDAGRVQPRLCAHNVPVTVACELCDGVSPLTRCAHGVPLATRCVVCEAA